MIDRRLRREPPPFRRLTVRKTEFVSPRMTRVIVGGDALEGFHLDEAAASVRLLLPKNGELVIPTWNGNEFLLADGGRPPIRTFTPRRFDPESLELHIDVVLHGNGAASSWAETARRGDPLAVSGPGAGYHIDPDATAYLLLGDETAIPAICQLLEYLPDVPIATNIAVTHADAIVDLHREVALMWHVASSTSTRGDALVAAARKTELTPGTRVWAAGEASMVQRSRRELFAERDFSRSHASVRGYWKDKPTR